MTWALVGVAAALAGTTALAVAGMIWALKRTASSHDREVEALSVQHTTDIRLQKADRDLAAAIKTIEKQEARIAREVAARKRVEEHLDQAIIDLSKTSTPGAAAAHLRADLERLRNLAKEMPDVPAATDPDNG
jgi:hypothetical protein